MGDGQQADMMAATQHPGHTATTRWPPANKYSPEALARWSCDQKTLPTASQIQYIHIYDFDNTLFHTPSANKRLWTSQTCGQLGSDTFLYEGGWWHAPNILAATGEGIDIEEPRAWAGFWNEGVVQLVQESKQGDEAPHTLSVLLTGRGEDRFADLIIRMLKSRGFEFDIIALKPSIGPDGMPFRSTRMFKQALLEDIIFTYPGAQQISIYEDRPQHTKGFRDFFTALNASLRASVASGVPLQDRPLRHPIEAEVVQVEAKDSEMLSTTEVTEVFRMVQHHNDAVRDGRAPAHATILDIKRTVYSTCYRIDTIPEIERLTSLVDLPQTVPMQEMNTHANSVLVVERPADPAILDKIGGIGAKMRWRVVAVANHGNRIWAAKVTPIPKNASIFTDNKTPLVVLATRRNAKPHEANYIAEHDWQPVPAMQAFEFETVVDEEVMLRIEEPIPGQSEYDASFPPNNRTARKHPRDEDQHPAGRNRPQNGGPSNYANRSVNSSHTAGRSNYATPAFNTPQQRGNYNGPQSNRGNANGIGSAASRGGGNSYRGGRGSHQGGRGSGGRRGGGGGGSQRGGGGRGGGRGAYRSLDSVGQQGYTGGSMQY